MNGDEVVPLEYKSGQKSDRFSILRSHHLLHAAQSDANNRDAGTSVTTQA